MRVTAIDFETANSSFASICAIGVALMEDGAIETVMDTLIKPEENVGMFYERNIQVHGILPEEVENAPRFSTIYQELQSYLEDTIVAAHNARFDMRCLQESCRNCGISVPTIRYFDTVELSRKVLPHLAHHRLNDVCDYFDIPLEHHNAASDAEGCLMIVARIMNLTGIYDIEELLKQCHTRTYIL